ncbi:Lipid-A-disaccharide synthase (modular protein) [uncultured Alphaproteobacteria bacterium]|uniref:Lipid-A-disaccharide synthase n=1 Tax=uncultured Alphaproteobacteria bacterium TaxID=91750 RepID=A0A212J850_9PROT|nr:Lipid-A-disaccharide synthase (modular protein) [uncultured Alphaproteobacteria bacterium]
MGETGKIGIIAGGGDLPRLLLSACRAAGREPFVLAIEGYAAPDLTAGTEHAWVRLGALGEAFRALKRAGVVEVVFAGAIRRPSLAALKPDARGAAFLARVGGKALGDDGLLRAVAAEFAREGLALKGAHELLSDVLAREGLYGSLAPDAAALADVARGVDVAKGVGALDVGQGAVVQQGIVLAVEAVEGTDSMLGRCAELRREGPGGVLVKVCKPGQDRRLDLPTIGVDTVEAAAAAGLRGIAVEAGAALVLDAAAVGARADALGLFVQGLAAEPPLVYLVAGEPSGDILGARLMRALKARTGGAVRFAGVGGESMAEEGLTSLFPQADIAVMGLAEVIPKIPTVLRRVRAVADDVVAKRPAVVVTIDSLGFNGRVAKALIARGSRIPRVHYVAPMVWAWKPGRAKAIAKLFDHLLCLLGFEPPYFTPHGLAATHVGHPVIEGGAGTGDGADFRIRHGIAAAETVLCVLPGSRRNEVARMLPVLRDAVDRLRARHPDLQVVIPTVATVAATVEAETRTWARPPHIVRGEAERWNAFAAADAALATSGTVTLELACAGVPFVIGYRGSPASAWLARKLISIKYATLLNHVANRMIVPEFLQEDCTAEALAAAADRLLCDAGARADFLREARAALAQLVGPFASPSAEAAEVVLKLGRIPVAPAAPPPHIDGASPHL